MKKVLFIFLLVLGILPSSNAQLAGALDSTFNQTGIIHRFTDSTVSGYQRVRVAADGKLLAFGYDRKYAYRSFISRYQSDGSPDESFATHGNLVNYNLISTCVDGFEMPDGRIITINDDYYNLKIGMCRLRSNGVVDSTYGINGVATVDPGVLPTNLGESFLQPDGKVVVLGNYHPSNNTTQEAGFVTRILPDGKADSTFGIAGTVKVNLATVDSTIILSGLTVQPDGKIIVSGILSKGVNYLGCYIKRLMPDGSPDPGFGLNGVVFKNLGDTYPEAANEIVLLPDGKMLIGGSGEKGFGYQFTVLRLKPDGTIDNTFGFGGKAQVSLTCCFATIYGMRVQADGKIVACGWAKDAEERPFIAVARFKPNGLVDQSFGDNGTLLIDLQQAPTQNISQVATTVAIQSDQKIVISGRSYKNDLLYGAFLLRLNPGAVVGTQNLAETIQNLEIAPNPVSDEAFTLHYSLTEPAQVTIALYDLLGRKISNVQPDEMRQEGEQEEKLFLPAGLAPGQYLLRLETAQGTKAIKLLKSE